MIGTKNEINRISWTQRVLRQLPDGIRLLDAGAGEQQFKQYCKHLEYVSQDFSQYDGSGDKKGLQVGNWDCSKVDIVSDITSIPEPDASFEAILCTEVFEHLPDPISAIVEFSRLLKPGGYLILTAPFCSLTHFSPYHFYTGFNKYFYEKHLSENGFEIVTLDANGNFFEFIAQEIHRLPAIAKSYSQDSLRPWERFAIKILLQSLQRFSNSDLKSWEVLNFGYQVFAVKNI